VDAAGQARFAAAHHRGQSHGQAAGQHVGQSGVDAVGTEVGHPGHGFALGRGRAFAGDDPGHDARALGSDGGAIEQLARAIAVLFEDGDLQRQPLDAGRQVVFGVGHLRIEVFQLDRSAGNVVLGLADLVPIGQALGEHSPVALQLVMERLQLERFDGALRGQVIAGASQLQVGLAARIFFERDLIFESGYGASRVLVVEQDDRLARFHRGAGCLENLDDAGGQRSGNDLLEAGNHESRRIEGRADLVAHDRCRAHPVVTHRGAQPAGDEHHEGQTGDADDGRDDQASELAPPLHGRVDQSVHCVFHGHLAK
jgi:hypothetical protein